MSFFQGILDRIKHSAIVRFAGPFIKSLAPWIVAGCIYIGVDPETADKFAESTVAVLTVALAFVLDLLFTYLRTRKIVKAEN